MVVTGDRAAAANARQLPLSGLGIRQLARMRPGIARGKDGFAAPVSSVNRCSTPSADAEISGVISSMNSRDAGAAVTGSSSLSTLAPT